MTLITLPAGAGKTTEAIRVAAEKDAYILCLNMKRVDAIVNLAEELKIKIRFPITFEEFAQSRQLGRFVNSIVIDDLDEMLPMIFSGVQIEAVTWTGK